MQNQNTADSGKTPKIQPVFNVEDEFDFESFSVKPLNSGLGFHQNKERSRPRIQRPSPAPTSTLSHSRPSAFDKKTQVPAKKEQMVSRQELSAFYGQEQFIPSHLEKKQETTEAAKLTDNRYEASSLAERFAAWFVDFLLITLLCCSLLGAFLVASGIGFNFDQLTTIFTSLEMVVFSLALYGLINLFYFTVLELGSTPGKSLFGLKTLNNELQGVSGVQSFMRALVALLSCLAVGLPLLLDFQSHLSDTKVYKKNV